MKVSSTDQTEDPQGAASCASVAADSIQRRAALRAMATAIALGFTTGPSGHDSGRGSNGAHAAELQDAAKPNEPAKSVATASRFPANAGKYLSGELVYIDSVNRRGGIRLDGVHGRYFTGPPHWFALLPHAPVWHNGARAELRDLPLGTYVHGYFIEPPPGDEATIPTFPDDKKQFAISTNHATLLEDDFSFYQRRGQAWKVVSLDLAKEKIRLEPIAIPPAAGPNASAPASTPPSAPESAPSGAPSSVPAKSSAGAPTSDPAPPPGAGAGGQLVKDGISKPYTFDIDVRTEVWNGRQLVEPTAIQPGMVVQFNLAWAQGWGEQEFRVGRIWIDDESRAIATERQRRRHVQFERERWTAGWIDDVEHFDYGGGIVTLTLFEVDQQILDDLWLDREERIAVAVAEKTRRTWFHRSDRKFGKLVEWKRIDTPPLGCSAVQLKLKFAELLTGYSAGACVRVKAERWKFVTMPPEERLTSSGDRERGARMVLPW